MDKLFNNQCPNCGGDNLDFDAIEPEGETLKQWVQCEGCGLGFNIYSENHWTYDDEDTTRNAKHIE